MDVFERIIAFLDEHHANYRVVVHRAVGMSAEVAEVRGTKLEQGAKAMVLRQDQQRYLLATLAANRRVDLTVLRERLGAQKIALASPEEVLVVTGCVVGSVPPFGSVVGLPTYGDPSLGENQEIGFNAGRLTHSIVMPYADYARIERPHVMTFAKVA